MPGLRYGGMGLPYFNPATIDAATFQFCAKIKIGRSAASPNPSSRQQWFDPLFPPVAWYTIPVSFIVHAVSVNISAALRAVVS